LPVAHLDQDTVKRLPQKEDLTKPDGSWRRQIFYWDDATRKGGLRGFGLLCSVNTKGEVTRGFVAQRSGGKRHSLGRFPDMSVKNARQAARAKLAEKTHHHDGTPVTLREAMEDYRVGMINRKLSKRSIADLERHIPGYLSDWLERPLRDISASEVRHRHSTPTKPTLYFDTFARFSTTPRRRMLSYKIGPTHASASAAAGSKNTSAKKR
jgi:hypothetical protein